MKQNAQRILCLLLAALLCCTLLAACSNQPEPQSQSTAEAPGKTTAEAQGLSTTEARIETEANTQEATSEQPAQQPAEDAPITIDNIRDYVIGVEEPIELLDGTTRPLINFDNAATTPALQPVADAVN